MQWAVVGVAAMVGVVACGSDSTPSGSTPPSHVTSTTQPSRTTQPNQASTTTLPVSPSDGRVESSAGFAFDYPEGWDEAGQAISTEFAAGAECGAAQIVDYEPPPDSGKGQAGYVLRSVVQVCARPVDDRSLDDFMRDVYPQLSFEPAQIGDRPAYKLEEGVDMLAFAQNDSYRFQLATTVVADPELEAIRIEQVDDIVATVTLD